MKSFKFYPIEFASMCMFFWYALILLLPMDTFSTSSSYHAMSYLLPEWAWGLICLHNGILQLVGMSINDRRWRNIHKRIGLLIATGFWIFLGTMFFLGNPASTATGIYIVIGIMNCWVYLNYYRIGIE